MTIRLLAVALFVSACINTIHAATVTPDKAQTVAKNFCRLTVNGANAASLVTTVRYEKQEKDGTVDFYVIDVMPVNAFVIVAGDDRANPVIGYSTTSYFKSNVTGTGVQDWMNGTATRMQYIVKNNVAAPKQLTSRWNSYINGSAQSLTRGTGAGPLLSTNWNQEPYFNDLCPYNTYDGLRCVTGCVATTMAQIMKFWSYPSTGTGSFSYNDSQDYGFQGDYGTLSANFGATTYNWAQMPAILTSSNTYVATLMYQCGVSVTMDYGDDYQGGSGSFVIQSQTPKGRQSAEHAYKTYFSYNPATLKGVLQTKYTSAAWIAMMKTEIDQGRPLQYEGQDDNGYGGHTWVCDGYDGNDMLHMNWGWGGQDNGYFDVSTLNPNVYNFDTDDGALIGIQPLSRVNVTAQAESSIICKGTGTKLTASGPKNATYTWLPATGLSCTKCATPTASPSVTTTYVLTADSNGVKGIYSLVVSVATNVTAVFTPDITRACSSPVEISFSNTSANALTYTWDFGDGTTSTVAAPKHTYADYGAYTVKLSSTGPCGTSFNTKTKLISVIDNDPTVAGSTSVCNGQSALLNASGTGTINWYDAPNGGTSVGTGTTFVTPALNSTKTYYAESDIEAPVMKCAPADNNFGQGGYFYSNNEHGLIFNCLNAQTLVSVDVVASSAGSRTIDLLDSTGNTLATTTVSVPTGLSTVPLNFKLPVENNLLLSCSGTVNLYRNNSGMVYPNYSSDSMVVLTGTDAGAAGYYYYFYNWKLQYASCISNRIPVVVDVLNAGAAFTITVNGNTVTFTPTDSNSNLLSYHWNFGDGATSDAKNPTHTYSSSSSYMVQLTESNSTCISNLTKEIDLATNGVNNLIAANGISVMPNPATSNLQLVVSGNSASGDDIVSIKNILGETLLTQNIHCGTGDNVFNINVKSLPSGVYFMRLTNSNGLAETRKFIKD